MDDNVPWYITRVIVYREDPVWDQHTKWFMVPKHILDGLYVCTYTLGLDEDGDAIQPAEQVASIREEHPDCVLIY